MILPRENLWLFLHVVLYCIPASMTENVLEISVLWQLCIRLIYGMALSVSCAIRNNIQRKSKNILFKFIIFNINF